MSQQKNPNEDLNVLDQVFTVIREATQAWKAENTEEVIKKQVKTLLDKNQKEIVMKLLGFDGRWDQEWKLDHCNGRSGNSTAGDFIKDANAAAIKEWLENFKPPELTAANVKSIKKNLKDDYLHALKDAVRTQVRHEASFDAKAILQQVSESTQIDKFLELQKSLQSPE